MLFIYNGLECNILTEILNEGLLAFVEFTTKSYPVQDDVGTIPTLTNNKTNFEIENVLHNT